MCHETNEFPNGERKRFGNRDGIQHPYVPNWSDILPPPPPIDLPPPLPGVSSSQLIHVSGSNPQSPKIHSKGNLHQIQNVITYELLSIFNYFEMLY